VEIRYGPGKEQYAFRYLLDYEDYVPVPFEVWDVSNNRQLTIAFVDAADDGEYDITKDGGDYFFGFDIPYNTNLQEWDPFWTVFLRLDEDFVWDPLNLPEATMSHFSFRAVKPLFDKAPPNLFDTTPEGLAEMADLARHMRGIEPRVLHDLVRLLTGSAADFLDDYFESEILKGYLASSSIIGTKVGPRSQGSGLVLLYHSLGEHDGEFGAWAFHKKGNGGFTEVLARAAALRVAATPSSTNTSGV
jgi:hypothetical protein